MQPFAPLNGNGKAQVIATSTSGASTAITNARPGAPVRIKNRSTTAGERIYFAFGGSTVGAPVAGTDMSIDPAYVETFTLPYGATHISHLAASGTPSLEIMPGEAGG